MPTKKTSKPEKKVETKKVSKSTPKEKLVLKPIVDTESKTKQKAKKKLWPIVLILVLILSIGAYFLFFKKEKVNEDEPDLVETPPQVNKFNSLALAKRPYITIIQNTKGSCGGIDINIDNLKNGETRAEFEVEYTHINAETGTKMIEGMFAEREFGEEKKHDPMMFGTCSGSKCRCHDDIISGTLKLHFYGGADYSLKGDYVVHAVSDEEIKSLDSRLVLDPSESLASTESILITSTFGLPGELDKKVIKGPYGIFVEDMPELDAPIKATFQGQDVNNGEIQLWDGEEWKVLEAEVADDKATFEIPSLGVIVLTEK